MKVEEEILGKVYDGRLMRRLLGYLKPYRGVVAICVVLLLAASVLQVVGPLLTKMAVDKYLAPVPSQAATPLDPYLSANPWIGLAQISTLFLLALLGAFLFDFAQAYLMQWTGQHAMLDLRRQLMAHLQRLDLSYYDRTPVGRMVTRVTTDVDALNELLASGLVTIIGDVLTLSFVVIVMLKLSAPMTGLLLAVMPFVVLVTVIFRRSATQSYRRIRVAIARINSYLQEHISGMAVLQLFNREKKSGQEFDEINRQHMLAFKEAIVAYAWFYPAVEFLAMLALAMLLTYSGFRINEGSLTLGVLVAFLQYGMRFFRPIQDLSEKYNLLQSAMAASERIFALLDTPVKIQAPAEAKKFPAGPARIEFDKVWFAYRGEEWVLRDVSFAIEPGETVAVVGHTGAGKTTLISLLLRFYDVQRGAIRIGGVDIRELDPRDLRRHFGVVLQDPHLFSGTIEGNIRLGTEWISEEALVSAVEQVSLLDFIDSLPDGFAQPVRERGDGLSTGQKQLISFARALAHNPRFLVLDEATSSVDTETEFRVREALARMVKGRTAIVIAHRLSTIQKADRILVMHKGTLRESGTHQELLAARGIYWKLYQLQYKDQERTLPPAGKAV
ncbi:MAG TPA: ABC transporter ATP-binding protein [Bryobacteraceae bacterium]|nr:ABC transporter ATP-binding protein [Bryobacteraceae bacterium]HOQ47546.1 ABC transporter ATP-binding protein [Bryobacteraceae bacterium]HPQ15853.1 ABC transporter ATP-binding protein [Bryobacteraceae bacterium]HPU73526.1 ABC transporter ATP-binding protein [Bryobacteraceae bacterium]